MARALAILGVCLLIGLAGTAIAQRVNPDLFNELDDDDYGRDCDAEGEQFQKEVRACLDGATTLDAAKLCWQP